MVFLGADPEALDHEIALIRGRPEAADRISSTRSPCASGASTISGSSTSGSWPRATASTRRQPRERHRLLLLRSRGQPHRGVLGDGPALLGPDGEPHRHPSLRRGGAGRGGPSVGAIAARAGGRADGRRARDPRGRRIGRGRRGRRAVSNGLPPHSRRSQQGARNGAPHRCARTSRWPAAGGAACRRRGRSRPCRPSPAPARAPRASRRLALGRRAADARDRPGADVEPPRAPDGRAVGGPGAADRRGGHGDHPPPEGVRACRSCSSSRTSSSSSTSRTTSRSSTAAVSSSRGPPRRFSIAASTCGSTWACTEPPTHSKQALELFRGRHTLPRRRRYRPGRSRIKRR